MLERVQPARPAEPGTGAVTPWRSAPLALLLFSSTLGVLGGAIIVPVLEVIRGGLGITGTQAGLILTTHGLAMALCSPLTGRIVDRWGIRRPMAGGLLLYGLGGGSGLVTTTYPALLAGRFVFGAGAAMVFTATTVALLSLYRGTLRDRVMGWRSVATTAGGVLWPMAAGLLGGLSWHTPFAIYLIGVPLGLAALLFVPDTRPAPQGADSGGVIRLFRRRPRLIGLYTLLMATALMMFVLAVFMPQRLAEVGVEDPFVVSIYSVVTGAAMASLVGMVYARVRARCSYAALLRTAAAAWTLGFLVFGVADHPLLLLVVPVLTGLGTGIVFPALTVLIDETAPRELRGRATSLQGTFNFVGQFTSPLLFGPLIAATSITTGSLVTAGLAGLILLVLLLATVPEPPRPDTGAPQGTAARG
ncbi:MFS transporter [Streptomyces sp. YIM 98790]|uniref:MFS transporter n=1 Tax=Streptomyces sp. YIM 98790 TaxID=2689077 RepID=UPI00140AAF51|nr:MFS transporter [Streptomyces sp. YIM 98790]